MAQSRCRHQKTEGSRLHFSLSSSICQELRPLCFPYIALMKSIASMDVVAEYTVRINLNEYKLGLLKIYIQKTGFMISSRVLDKGKK